VPTRTRRCAPPSCSWTCGRPRCTPTGRPWYRAAAYCEYIRDATYGSLGHGLLDMPFPGYAPARLGSVEAHGDPRKAMGDVTGMAHYQLDLQFTYVQSDLVIT
jgi:hypothetical protein